MATCRMCEGRKVVPATWEPDHNPKLDADPNSFRIKDGRVIRGVVYRRTSDKTVFRTEGGQYIEVPSDQIVPRTSASSTNKTQAPKP